MTLKSRTEADILKLDPKFLPHKFYRERQNDLMIK